MNEQKNMTGYVLVDDDIINREPMRTLIRKEGVEGLGAVTALLLLLCNHSDATAKLASLKPLSCQLRVSYPYLLHIIKDYRMFRLTADRLSFRRPTCARGGKRETAMWRYGCRRCRQRSKRRQREEPAGASDNQTNKR